MLQFFCSQHIIKRFAGVVALSDGNLEAHPGEVVALIGANGSGKSTLCKIITGVVAPDEGQLLLNEKSVSFKTPHEAQSHGISAVYQDLSLVPSMSVAENIWLTHEPLTNGILVNRQEIRKRSQALIDLFAGTIHSRLTPEALVSSLPPDEQQIVEILKALSTDPQIMILDEATASLDNRQVARLFDLIADWKSKGKAIIFISHRLGEIFRIADQITVLRNGKTVGVRKKGEVTEKELLNLMVEEDSIHSAAIPESGTPKPETINRPLMLQVTGLYTSILENINLEVRAGELVGIGGLQGQGQSDLLLAIFGAIPFAGNLNLEGKSVHFKHPIQAMENGVAYVPGDRARDGLMLRSSIFENLLLPNWMKYGFPLKISKAVKAASETAKSMNVVMSDVNMSVSNLSGGNAQKIVLGKWMQRNPKLFLLNDPTKGVDVGTKGEFYALLKGLRDQGAAIIFFSSDDEELVSLCDRILVMYNGKLRKELSGTDLTLSTLVATSLDTTSEY